MSPNLDALVPYGFTERVLALWNVRLPDMAAPGRVVRVDGATCQVACGDPAERTCRAKLPVAVGDWVAVEDDTVDEALPRWSVVARADPSAPSAQVLAVNVDVVVIAAPADRLKLARVEREVVLAWECGARPLVVLTKADLDDGRLLASLRSRVGGADVVATSGRRGDGLAGVAATLSNGSTGLLIGPSGAGKSTLVNALVGQEVQATGDVRVADHRGRHTTTARRLLCLPGGGVLIDTPGMRSLGIAGPRAVGASFPDIEELAQGCRFRDCAHGKEPGCEVRAAVAEGRLDRARLVSFEKLAREAAAARRRSDPLEAHAMRRMWTQRAQEVRRYDKRRGL